MFLEFEEFEILNSNKSFDIDYKKEQFDNIIDTKPMVKKELTINLFGKQFYWLREYYLD